MLSSHQRLGLPSGLLPPGLPTEMLYAPLTSPMRAICPAHLILLALITLTISGEDYKPWKPECDRGSDTETSCCMFSPVA
jgi:hypothetical protein